MPEARDFHLGDILTVTTDRLVTPTGMAGLYGILNFMTGDDLFTHQLIRAGAECKGPLLEQHPDLAAVQVPDDFASKEAVFAWLDEQVARYGETRPVAPLAEVDHTRIDPIEEMRMIRPDMPVITVEIGEGDHA